MSETRLATGTLSAPSSADPRLLIGCYRLNFASGAPIRFSDFPGSAWRGAFGHALARFACASGARDFRSLVAVARSVRAETALQWRKQERYSARQKTGMKLGGVIGTLRIEGQHIFRPSGLFCGSGSGLTPDRRRAWANGTYEIASLPFRPEGGARGSLAAT